MILIHKPFPGRAVLPLLLFLQVVAHADLITFEGLADGTPVVSQYSGLTFANAIILTAGISLNEFEFPPHSGANVIFDSGSPLTIEFAVPVLSISGYFTYLSQLTLTAFDSGNNQVEIVLSAFGNNLARSGDPGSSPNEFLMLAHPTGISRLTVGGDPFGGSFVADDINYTSAVPEPATYTLLFTATAFVAITRRKQYKP